MGIATRSARTMLGLIHRSQPASSLAFSCMSMRAELQASSTPGPCIAPLKCASPSPSHVQTRARNETFSPASTICPVSALHGFIRHVTRSLDERAGVAADRGLCT